MPIAIRSRVKRAVRALLGDDSEAPRPEEQTHSEFAANPPPIEPAKPELPVNSILVRDLFADKEVPQDYSHPVWAFATVAEGKIKPGSKQATRGLGPAKLLNGQGKIRKTKMEDLASGKRKERHSTFSRSMGDGFPALVGDLARDPQIYARNKRGEVVSVLGLPEKAKQVAGFRILRSGDVVRYWSQPSHASAGITAGVRGFHLYEMTIP